MNHEIEAKHHVCRDVDVIAIKGEINSLADFLLTEVLLPLLREGRRKFVLDFTDVVYITSSGVNVLVSLLIAVHKDRGRIVMTGLSEHYEQIFTINRLADVMPVFPTVSDAVAALQGSKADGE